jgi:conjugative relaxase-like TrwC/TraI family protein
MLSIGVLQSSAQAGTYYAQDNYYIRDSQVAGIDAGGLGGPSRWDGSGATELGLTGAVDQGQFERLLNGELPNGVVLKRGQQGKHQPGWDLTFSAPKSVSLLALVAAVFDVHRACVDGEVVLGEMTDQRRVPRPAAPA